MQLRKVNPKALQLLGEKGHWEVETRTAELGDQVMARNNALEPGGITDQLAETIKTLIDDDPCSFDHHGHCQTHSLTKPCVNERAKAVLLAYRQFREKYIK